LLHLESENDCLFLKQDNCCQQARGRSKAQVGNVRLLFLTTRALGVCSVWFVCRTLRERAAPMVAWGDDDLEQQPADECSNTFTSSVHTSSGASLQIAEDAESSDDDHEQIKHSGPQGVRHAGTVRQTIDRGGSDRKPKPALKKRIPSAKPKFYCNETKFQEMQQHDKRPGNAYYSVTNDGPYVSEFENRMRDHHTNKKKWMAEAGFVSTFGKATAAAAALSSAVVPISTAAGPWIPPTAVFRVRFARFLGANVSVIVVVWCCCADRGQAQIFGCHRLSLRITF
jgi:hypothetical protein